MTRVLIISNKSDVTSDFIVQELRRQGFDFYRFNTEELTKSISVELNFRINSYTLFDSNLNIEIDLKSFTSVYYRRPEIASFDYLNLSKGETNFIKGEVVYTLEGIYKIIAEAYWVSPLYSIREAENKIYQLKLAMEIGFNIPESVLTNSYDSVAQFYLNQNKNCIIKPIKSGLIEDSKNGSVVFTNKLSGIPLEKEAIENCPVYLQNCIEKNCDIRVTVIGNKIFSTAIKSQEHNATKIDWRKGEIPLIHSKIEIPLDLQQKCVRLLKILNLRFGAIDFILDKNDNYHFLEINPNGQWAWIEKQTGYPLSKEIVKLLSNENF